MKSLIHLTVISLIFCVSLQGQEVQKIDLDAAIQYAFNNNITIKNAQLNIADAQQQIVESTAIGLPKLDGAVSYQRYLEIPQQPLPEAFVALIQALNPNEEVETNASFFLRNNLTASLNLETMIFDGSYFVGLKAAKAYKKYVQQDLLTQRREVKNNVINAYFPVLLVKENLQILDKNISNLEKLLNETKALYAEGFVEQLDIDRQELSLSNLKTEKDNLLRQLENAKTNLKFAMGYPVDSEIEVSGNLEAFDAEADDKDIVGAFNYANRPEVELIEIGNELNELNLKNYKSQYWPNLRANAAYTYQYQGDNLKDGFWSPLAFVGVNLNIPIFDGLDKKAKIQRTMLDMQEAENQKTELQQAIQLEIKTARTSYISAKEKLANQEKNLALAERIYETTQVKYREGVGSSLEVTQAEQSLYTSQSNYLQALYDLVIAKQQLDIALGQ